MNVLVKSISAVHNNKRKIINISIMWLKSTRFYREQSWYLSWRKSLELFVIWTWQFCIVLSSFLSLFAAKQVIFKNKSKTICFIFLFIGILFVIFSFCRFIITIWTVTWINKFPYTCPQWRKLSNFKLLSMNSWQTSNKNSEKLV